MMLKAYKYRLYPTKSQADLLNKHLGSCRFIFNLALETKQMAYAGNKVNLSCFDLHKQLTDLKKELAWLKEVNSQSLQQSINNLDVAYTKFFKGLSDFPKYKSKRGRQSFQIPQNIELDFEKEKLFIPKFKEAIKIIISRKFKGEIKTSTISRTPTGKYFISILCDNKKELPKKTSIKEKTTVGIDLGILSFIATSNGLSVSNPKYLKESLSHLKYLQRQVSKKVKGSDKRKRAILKLSKCHEKVANQRKDFLQKLSTKIISENQTICVENLAVSNMVKNHCLAQSISDSGWTSFVQMLKYKSEWYGKNFLQIGRFEASSKTCSSCGAINKNLTLDKREWICTCGREHDRDINAAINIKYFALRNSGVECTSEPMELPTLVGTMKLESPCFSLG